MKKFNDGCRKVKKACFIASSGCLREELMCLGDIIVEEVHLLLPVLLKDYLHPE